MNDKDREAFDQWFGLLGETHLERVVKLNMGAPSKAWQAACEYKQKEIDSIDCYIERDEKIKKLQDENAKLRECVEYILNYKRDEYMSMSRGSIFEVARQALKELEEK